MPIDNPAPATNFRRRSRHKPTSVLTEICLRITTASLFLVFANNAYTNWLANPTRLTLLFLVFLECLTVGITLVSKVPQQRDWSLLSVLSSLVGTYYFLGIQLLPGLHLVPEPVGVALQITGFIAQVYAKLSLKFSFGLLPANRGIVTRGAYRIVRHPIYLSYFIANIGFLLVNFSTQNLILYTVLFGIQGVRILREEKFLSQDPEYLTYKSKVKFRVLPGVF